MRDWSNVRWKNVGVKTSRESQDKEALDLWHNTGIVVMDA